MRTFFLTGLILTFCLFSGCTFAEVSTTINTGPAATSFSAEKIIALPGPRLKSDVSLEDSLFKRRSIREYSPAPLKLEEVSQLLWSAQGLTSENGGRTAPSAGALYPLEIYLVSGNVDHLASGIYKYSPRGHSVIVLSENDIREGLCRAALNQSPVKNGAVCIVISAVYERTAQKYGDRGIRYAQMEVGHAAQNICLQATALGLGAVTIGAFDDNGVKNLLRMADNETPLYIIPVGRTK